MPHHQRLWDVKSPSTASRYPSPRSGEETKKVHCEFFECTLVQIFASGLQVCRWADVKDQGGIITQRAGAVG
ncbi:hypothetical protein BREVUG8_90294 [Brevundimonas sp. G8]|nr:hypothetical protein BREVUG8_90294 [Brevundimonas sp. G8]